MVTKEGRPCKINKLENMFQIPDDDDDEFWNDIPLDIGHQSSSVGKENKPQLRIPHTVSLINPPDKIVSFNQGHCGQPVGQHPSNNIGSIQQNPRNETSPVSTSSHSETKSMLVSRTSAPNYTPSGVKQSEMRTTAPERNRIIQAMAPKQFINNSEGNSLHSVANGERVGANSKVERTRSRSGDGQGNDYITPKRRRKFPGPAGILPKLAPGRSLDALSPSILNPTSPDVSRSTEDDSVVASSQTSDDVFNESAWQTLLSDLNEDGQKLLKKFSITSTLHKAGKKQLHQGKAGLIFGVIESVESHGSEASVNIRDKSGRMQGTIHRELLKEYETELQPGTVLVLKQVSIISLSNRNHYLNITPNNIVALYYVRQDTLKSRMFHGSQDSLCSVLSALEKKADANQNRLNTSLTVTPPGSSRQSPGGSNCSTPQLYRPSPNEHHGTPVGMTTQHSRLPGSVIGGQNNTPVRDVSGIGGRTPQTLNQSYNIHHNSASVPVLNNRASPSPRIQPGTSQQKISTPSLTNHSNAMFNNQSAVRSAQFNNRSTERNTQFNNKSTERIIKNNDQNMSTPGLTTYKNPAQLANESTERTTQLNNQSTARSAQLNNQSAERTAQLNNQSMARTSPINNQNAESVRPEAVGNQTMSHNNSQIINSLCTTPNVLQCKVNHSMPSNTNSDNKSKWKFKSPPSRSSSACPSPNIPQTYNHSNHKPLNSTSSSNSAGNSRNCQLNVGMQNRPVESRTSVSSHDVKTGNRPVSEVSTEVLWGDDLSDEILSQLSEDFS